MKDESGPLFVEIDNSKIFVCNRSMLSLHLVGNGKKKNTKYKKDSTKNT